MRRLNIFQNRPKLTKIDAITYLERLEVNRQNPDEGYLKQLHKAHLHQIPHENLEVQFGRTRKWDINTLFDLIIARPNRGGLGLELNFLFYHLLDQLGFRCYPVAAGSKKTEHGYGQYYEHMVLIVAIKEEQWLVDVGSRKGPLLPKKMVENQLQVDYNRYMRMQKDADDNWLLQISNDMSNFTTIYGFAERETQYIEFIDKHHFYQTDPDSFYVDSKFVQKWTREGQMTLTGRKIANTSANESARPIMNEDEFLSKLEEYYDIQLADLLQ